MEYEWLINGVSSNTTAQPTLSIPYNSQSTITLVTTSLDGCKDTLDVIVNSPKFENLLETTISNIFTPNNDGLNDYFEVLSNGILNECSDLKIFNRDGVIAYKSSGGVHQWDGRSEVGKEFPDGVYFYVYTINGKEYHGNVTLMR